MKIYVLLFLDLWLHIIFQHNTRNMVRLHENWFFILNLCLKIGDFNFYSSWLIHEYIHGNSYSDAIINQTTYFKENVIALCQQPVQKIFISYLVKQCAFYMFLEKKMLTSEIIPIFHR